MSPCKVESYILQTLIMSRVVFSVVIAASMLNSIAPNMITFTRAATAAAELFTLIDRVSEIDPLDLTGSTPAHVDGAIDFHGVTFSYPTRPNVTVLNNFSLHVPAGKVTALVVSRRFMGSQTLKGSDRFFREPVVLARARSSDCWKDGTTLATGRSILTVHHSMS